MRLSVIFLVTFFVGSLSQYHQFERRQPWLSPYQQQQQHYYPARSYYNNNPFYRYFPYFDDNTTPEEDGGATLFMTDDFPDVDSRAAIRRPFVQSGNQLAPEQRFFGALLGGNNAITITSTSRNGLFKTRTVASLAQTLYTITSTTYCIPGAQVIAGAGVCAAGRRRREIAFLSDLVEEAKRQHQEKEKFLKSVIAPDSVEKLTTTEAPMMGQLVVDDSSVRGELTANNQNLESSQFNDDRWYSDDQRDKRSFFIRLLEQTTSLSITNCSTTTTSTLIQLNLAGLSGSGSTAESGSFTISAISCIPSGLVTCPAAG